MCGTHSFMFCFVAAQLLQQVTKDDMRGMSWLHFDTPVKKARVQEAVLVGAFTLLHSQAISVHPCIDLGLSKDLLRQRIL